AAVARQVEGRRLGARGRQFRAARGLGLARLSFGRLLPDRLPCAPFLRSHVPSFRRFPGSILTATLPTRPRGVDHRSIWGLAGETETLAIQNTCDPKLLRSKTPAIQSTCDRSLTAPRTRGRPRGHDEPG